MDDDKKATVAGLFCCIFIASIIMFSLSWDTVEPTEFGLVYNSVTKNIQKDKIYTGGRYFVWLAHSFIRFPSTLQSIEFSDSRYANAPVLRTRTAEGLALGLAVSFQYRLVKEKLPELYNMNNLQYQETFIRIARDVILQAAGQYEAPIYWEERTQIGVDMQHLLDIELQKAYARCEHLQVLRIELPDAYEKSIVDTQVEKQNVRAKKFEQDAARIRAETALLNSSADAQINLINATAQADAFYIRQQAKAISLNNTILAEGWSYSQTKTQLGLTTSDALSKFLLYQALAADSNKAQVTVGLGSAIINVAP